MADRLIKKIVSTSKLKVVCKIGRGDIARLMWVLAGQIENNIEDYESGRGIAYLDEGGCVDEWLYEIEDSIRILECLLPQHIHSLREVSEKEGNSDFLCFSMGDYFVLRQLAKVRHLFEFPPNVEEYYLEWNKARLAKREV